MSIQEDFEKWYADTVMVSSDSETIAEWTWQACAAHYEAELSKIQSELPLAADDLIGYIQEAGRQATEVVQLEAERNALLACLAQKDAGIRAAIEANKYMEDSQTEHAYLAEAERLLSIQPDNCRLVAVDAVRADNMEQERIVRTDGWRWCCTDDCIETLYTIKVKGE